MTSRTRTWRNNSEGLNIHCIAKASEAGVNGNPVHFMVKIAHGAGVLDAIQYHGRLNGEKFAELVHWKFPSLF